MNDETKNILEKTNLLERTVAYSLTINGIGTSRKVSSDKVRTDADPDRLRVSKRILDCDEMKGIRRLNFKLRNFIKARSVPYPLKSGIYLIPIDLLEEVDAEVERVRPLREDLVLSLSNKIAKIRENDREHLGSLFNDLDYPTPERIRAEFSIDSRYIALDLPGNLRAVSKAVFDRERERMKKEVESAGLAVRQVQRATMKTLVDSLIELLTPREDGKKKMVRKGGALDKMFEFLNRFGQLNVTDDDDLSKIVAEAKGLLKGIDVETIRTQEAVAEGTKKNMERVQGLLEPMIQDVPRRRFFNDSE
jgi:hypothetical protein